MRKNMVEINGKRFVTPKVAGDCFGMSHQAVTAACNDGRVVGACKDTSGKWIIPVDAQKPLDSEVIRKVMISSLVLKNKPTLVFDMPDKGKIIQIYNYLRDIGCIEEFCEEDDRLPYNVILTNKGMKIATEGSPLNIDYMNVGTTLVQVVASIITIWQALPIS